MRLFTRVPCLQQYGPGFCGTLLVLSLSSPPAGAQTTNASLSGTVSDSSGASIGGALVSVKSNDTGQVLTTTTGADGDYTLLSRCLR